MLVSPAPGSSLSPYRVFCVISSYYFVSIPRLFVFLIFADFVQAWVKASVLKGGLSTLLPLLPLTSWQPLTTCVHLESTRQPACSDKPNRRNSTVYKRMELGAFPTALEIAMVFLG